jgi:uncharacterized protein YuzE
MTLFEAVPELVGDIEAALIRLGRGDIADQLRTVTLKSWTFDDFAQATYLQLAAAKDANGVEEAVSLHDDIGVTIDLDTDGRVTGIEVVGYEEPLSRLSKHMAPKAG